LHVIPIGDEQIHAAQEVCWCHPVPRGDGRWTHNAKDCRERLERQTGEQVSEGWVMIAEYVWPPKKQVPVVEVAFEVVPAAPKPEKRFGRATSRHSDPDTSAQAADSVRGRMANELELKVLEVLAAHPEGLTGQEVTDLLGLARVTTSPRFAPLCRKGLIHDSGHRRKGPTGRAAIVWKATVQDGQPSSE
jgi:hypothetical protein